MKLTKTDLKQMIREAVINEIGKKKNKEERISQIVKEEINKAKKNILKEAKGTLKDYVPFVVEQFDKLYEKFPQDVEAHIKGVYKSKDYKDFLSRIAYDLRRACYNCFGSEDWTPINDDERVNNDKLTTLLKQGLKQSKIKNFVNDVMNAKQTVNEDSEITNNEDEEDYVPTEEEILYNLNLYAWNTRYIYDKIEALIKSLNKKDDSVISLDILANSFVMKKIVADCVKEGNYQKVITPQIRKHFAQELAKEIIDRKDEWK